jgi:hypothetical protein
MAQNVPAGLPSKVPSNFRSLHPTFCASHSDNLWRRFDSRSRGGRKEVRSRRTSRSNRLKVLNLESEVVDFVVVEHERVTFSVNATALLKD